MKMAYLETVIVMMVLIVAVFASPRTGWAEEGDVILQYAPKHSPVVSSMTSVVISQASADRQGEGFMVSGKIKRFHEIHLPGHVDLTVCASDGTFLARKSLRVPGLHSNRKGVLELPFAFRLDFVPPAGAKVRLEYHAPPFGGENHLRCT